MGADPEAILLRRKGETVNSRMLWFDEAKDFGFILTEEGERIYVHRSGFLPGEGSGRSLRPPPGAVTATVPNGKRVAIDVSMVPEEAHGRARQQGANLRSAWP
jgi:hypothetical protein